MPGKGSELRTRVVTAAVVLAVVFVLTWVPIFSVVLALLVAGVAVVGVDEYLRFTQAKGVRSMRMPGMIAVAAIVLSGYSGDVQTTAGVLAVAVILVTLLHAGRTRFSVEQMAVSVFALVYVGWFASHLVLLHRIGFARAQVKSAC